MSIKTSDSWVRNTDEHKLTQKQSDLVIPPGKESWLKCLLMTVYTLVFFFLIPIGFYKGWTDIILLGILVAATILLPKFVADKWLSLDDKVDQK